MAAVLGNPRGLAFLMVGALVGVLGGFLVLKMMLGSGSAAPAAPVAHVEYEGPLYRIKDRIYNLSDPNARRYVKMSLSLQFAAETDKYQKAEGPEFAALLTAFELELAPEADHIQDTLTILVGSKTIGQLLSTEGKEGLKNEIVTLVNAFLEPKHHVTKVFFTDFVVQ